MIAVIKVGGHQAIVSQGDVLEIDKIDAEAGKTVKFETLLVSEENGDGCKIGAPVLEGTSVEAKIVEHGRGKKVKVYKMKPRKRYRRTRGHRQDYTVVEVTKIGASTAPKKTAAAPTTEKTVKEETSKKAAPKKAAAKKVAKNDKKS